VLGCRHQCSSGLRSNCSSLLDPTSHHCRLCVVHAHLCRWRAGNLCRDSTCWCSHVSPPNHISFNLPFGGAKQKENMPHWVLLDFGPHWIRHSVTLQNLQLAVLLSQISLHFPTSIERFKDRLPASNPFAPLPPFSRPQTISPCFHTSGQTTSPNPHRNYILRAGGMLHRLGRCDWFLCCHCSLLAAAC